MKKPEDDGLLDRIVVGIIVIVASALILAKALPASKQAVGKPKTETAGSSKAK